MAAYECNDSNKAEQRWFKWLSECEKLVGLSLAAIEDHSDLYDYYCEGCTPSEAVVEAKAQGQFHD